MRPSVGGGGDTHPGGAGDRNSYPKFMSQVAVLVDETTGKLIGARVADDAGAALEAAWVNGEATMPPEGRWTAREVTRPGEAGWFTSGETKARLHVLNIDAPAPPGPSTPTDSPPPAPCAAPKHSRQAYEVLLCSWLATFSAEKSAVVRMVLDGAEPDWVPEVQADLRWMLEGGPCDPDKVVRRRIQRGEPTDDVLSALLMAKQPPPASLPPGAIPEPYAAAFALLAGTPPASP